MNNLISVHGTTAIGKTALAIKLANSFDCDILSCDSRQFFKEMSIGTAVPSEIELSQAKHHFIQNMSVLDKYDVGSFEKDSLELLEKLYKTNDTTILAGGSGLYCDALLYGLDEFPEIDKQVRVDLEKDLKEKGFIFLQEKLKEIDINSYNSIDLQNPHRLIRALEVGVGSDRLFSDFKTKKRKKRSFNIIKIGLEAPREIIYERINKRVDIMIENGLVEEVKKMYDYKHLNALQTVGYKEIFSYIDGDYTLEFAIEDIKKNTRRYAKRQLTWLRKDLEIKWFSIEDDIKEIIDYCISQKK
ncbi:MAG: tRNA (adenosine(37)-N6)-dimethylallyltransferase MiaA [Flavobacteriaceae bacterium]|nr:tRNA (adenosine(37)-N6)-dimethylallyltransferase MiaA [Flavobacteriaceae bacterium]